MELVCSHWSPTTRHTTLLHVCEKAVNLSSKWQTLVIISSEYALTEMYEVFADVFLLWLCSVITFVQKFSVLVF